MWLITFYRDKTHIYIESPVTYDDNKVVTFIYNRFAPFGLAHALKIPTVKKKKKSPFCLRAGSTRLEKTPDYNLESSSCLVRDFKHEAGAARCNAVKWLEIRGRMREQAVITESTP